MFFKSSLMLLLILFVNIIDAQNSIIGKIYDSKTKDPIFGASVYINNSTNGKASDKNGSYELKISSGYYEVVASMIGYKTDYKLINVQSNTTAKLDFFLEEKDLEMPELEIKDLRSEDWYEKLKLFKTYFLGTNSYSDFCTIKNEEDIYVKTSKDDSVSILAKNPLIIINEALGYKIECDLIRFTYVFKDQTIAFLYKMKFEDMIIANKEEKEEFKRRRIAAYSGTLKHFFRTLKNNSFADQYSISLIDQPYFFPKKEKEIRIREEILLYNIATNEYKVSFENYLKIIYRLTNSYSFIKMTRENIVIDALGSLTNPLDFIVFGAWAADGISRSLPNDLIFAEFSN